MEIKMKATILAVLFLSTQIASAVKMEAVKFEAPKAPKLEGYWLPTKPPICQPSGRGQLDGPEDISIGADGWIYTGTADGYIKKISLNGVVQNHAYTGGHPLGMDFDADGNLIVCEAYSGLYESAHLGK